MKMMTHFILAFYASLILYTLFDTVSNVSTTI